LAANLLKEITPYKLFDKKLHLQGVFYSLGKKEKPPAYKKRNESL